MLSSLSHMTIWELAGRHSVARDNDLFITCSKIELEIGNRSFDEQQILKQLSYYWPVEEVKSVLPYKD